MEHIPQPLQRAAYGRLAEQQARCGACDIPFFGKNREDDQEVEIGLS